MKYLKQYKIFEVRGYMTELEDAADEIINTAKDKDKFSILVKVKRGNFFVNVEVMDEKDFRKDHRGEATCYTQHGKNPTLYLNREYLHKPTIIHELKHAFSHTFGSKKTEKFNRFINSLQQCMGESYDDFFRVPAEFASITLYILNSEELEAFYHGMYADIKEGTKGMDDKTKRSYVDLYLDQSILFPTLRKFRNGDFEIENLFKSKNKMYLFFDWYKLNITKKSDNILDRLFDRFKILINRYRTSADYSPVVKDINREIGNNCKKYYKKFMRLYTI
jgi:hypothetical protein